MTSKDILFERLNHRVGENVKVPKLVKGDSVQWVDAEIVAMYPNHCLVQDKPMYGQKPKYKWSVPWTDLIRVGVK